MIETETSAAPLETAPLETAPVETWSQPSELSLPSSRDRHTNQAALIAARIARVLAPTTVLDLSASSLLTEHLAEVGINAEHVPISEADDSPPEIKPGQWDVIVCLGVLERLAPDDAETLLELMCQSATTVIASCGPATYFAPAAATVRPAAAWAAGFAERGFYRRLDLDIEFAGPWTVVFERGAPTLRELVYRYEQALSAAQAELSDRSATGGQAGAGGIGERAAYELESEIADLKHRLLISRDYAIGQEAELERGRAEVEEVRKMLDDVYQSNTWRMGSAVARPLNKLKRTLGSRA